MQRRKVYNQRTLSPVSMLTQIASNKTYLLLKHSGFRRTVIKTIVARSRNFYLHRVPKRSLYIMFGGLGLRVMVKFSLGVRESRMIRVRVANMQR